MVRIIPRIKAVYTISEKTPFAFALSPSPRVFAVMALPPEPIIKPSALIIISTGIMKLTAANGVFPTKFDTNRPSITQ